MAVSILSRPFGYLRRSSIDPQSVTNNIGNAFLSVGGYTDTVFIYLKTPVERYNGFWQLQSVGSDIYWFKDIDTGEVVRYIKDVSLSEGFINKCSRHTWNCVHLPIIYKISNNLWPTNSITDIRDISSASNSNGYTQVTLPLAANITTSLETVIITGCDDEALNKVWRVIEFTTTTNFVLDIPYSSAFDTDLTNNGSIQLYFDNYVVKVEIWGGLNNAHEYYAQKPYELLTTLELIPDDNNTCTFSIHEILKKQIEIENNLLLGTLPNNLDAFTKFFIKTGEEFDISDGQSISRSTVVYTSDLNNFEGIAVNAMLPFKNVYSGALSEYASSNSQQKFLTLFETPVIFTGRPFYLGLLWEGVRDITIKKQWYLNNVIQNTDFSDGIDSFYTGVYRASIEDNCIYDRVDITAYSLREFSSAPTLWTDITPWTSKTSTEFNYTDPSFPYSTSQSYLPISVTEGDAIKINFNITLTGTYVGSILVETTVTDSGNVGISNSGIVTFTSAGSATIEATLIITQTLSNARLQILFSTAIGNSGSINLTITPTYSAHADTVISETKQLEINCDCVKSKAEDGIYLMWSNYLGDFDSWLFTGYKDHIIDVEDTGETQVNIFPEWPNSWGEFADTASRKQTFRKSVKQLLVRSQSLTLDQVTAIQYIRTSPLVQIVNSIYDRRTVIVDSDSFTLYQEGQKEQYTISFTITYTDDVPSQRV